MFNRDECFGRSLTLMNRYSTALEVQGRRVVEVEGSKEGKLLPTRMEPIRWQFQEAGRGFYRTTS